jgi:hypothetical protein
MSTEQNKLNVQDILENIRPALRKAKVKRYTIRRMLNGDFRIRFKVPGNRLSEIYADLFLTYKPGIEIHFNFEHGIVTITKKHTFIDVQNSDTISKN